MPHIFGSGSRLVDLGVVCLICLRDEPGFCSIYGQDLDTPQMQIVDKIRCCSVLQLEKPEISQLPNKICHGCRTELSITYRFQQKCIEAEKVFRTATTATTLLLDMDKLELEQQQILKLPASLKIKRLEAEPPVPEEIAPVIKPESNKLLSLDVEWAQREEIEDEQLELQQELAEAKLEEPEEAEEDEELQALDGTEDYALQEEVGEEELEEDEVPAPAIPAQPFCSIISAPNRRTNEPKICDICGNTYRYQHALNAHMRRHNNERPYPCEVCQKAFISNVELRRHMRVHTGQKPYGCHYCERRFSDFGSSKKHERIHTGERPYVCEVCSKGFAYAHVLSVHRRTHTGKKQFQCTHCDKGFTKKSYLLAHMEQHRGGGSTGNEAANTSQGAGAMELGATKLRLPVRKRERTGQQLHLTPPAAVNEFELGMETKVLEECIVTNDFMFNDDAQEQQEHNYHDTELDENAFETVQHVKVPYGLVGDLLDDDLVNAAKYLIE
ncbi:CG9215 [Drosophila busckii]|uniref:CG9215 n=1 Tax=Drosophila busckii TaxID=30019 RepID=A0A0M4EX86_DROBS|nr:zinc finger and SCAN domain-containing protein 12 [Drosophila busckii]ALC48280.1 CG9215 [Drosophila busckii]